MRLTFNLIRYSKHPKQVKPTVGIIKLMNADVTRNCMWYKCKHSINRITSITTKTIIAYNNTSPDTGVCIFNPERNGKFWYM